MTTDTEHVRTLKHELAQLRHQLAELIPYFGGGRAACVVSE
jgi:hypothetical protein